MLVCIGLSCNIIITSTNRRNVVNMSGRSPCELIRFTAGDAFVWKLRACSLTRNAAKFAQFFSSFTLFLQLKL